MNQTGRTTVSEADSSNSMLLVPDTAGTGSGLRFLPQVDFRTRRQMCATLVIMLLIEPSNDTLQLKGTELGFSQNT